MATAGGGSAADLGSRGLLRLLCLCVLLAGEASLARELHSARRTLRSSQPSVSWFPSSRPLNPLSLSFPSQKFPLPET